MNDYNIITLDEYNSFFDESITQEQLDLYQFLAITQFEYLIGVFPTKDQFDNMNEKYQYNIRLALMYQIRYISENEDMFFEGSENINTSNVKLGRFSMSAKTNYDPKMDIVNISLLHLYKIGLNKTRPITGGGCGICNH